jgi:hypothetical protein
LKDIYDLDKTVRSLSKRKHTVRVEAGAVVDKSRKFNYGNYRYDITAIESSKTTFIATLVNSRLAELQSFGVINPLSIAWEVVPFSFVVDWFIPIGATLEALTSTAGFRNDGGWTSCQRQYTLNVYRNIPEDGNVLDDPGHYQEIGFDFLRIAYAEWPQTRVYADTTPTSTPRALNALALMSTLRS